MPEVVFSGHRAVSHFLRRTVNEDGAIPDNVCSVGYTEGFPYVMICYHYSNALGFLQDSDYFLDLRNGNGIYAGERLIQKQKLGLENKSPGQACPPGFPIRKIFGRVKRDMFFIMFLRMRFMVP